jgi:sugar transferase (PEP-CTERM/EpsH1 system associated)
MPEILFLAHRIPFPPDRGDKIRSWNVLRALAKLGRVQLACFADDEEDAAHLAALREALPELGEAHVEVRRVSKAKAGLTALSSGKPLSLTLFDSADMRRFVTAKLPEIDVVYVFSGQMAQFIPADAPTRIIMDFVDMDSEKFAAYAADASGPMRSVYAREAKRLFAFEREVAAGADASLFVSTTEAELFRRRSGLPRIHAVANGIDSAFFDPAASFPQLSPEERGQGPLLLFTGQMDYRPNIDAVVWFAREVLPRVPGARFVIAGRNPSAEVLALAGPKVTITGSVADMRSWLAAADVVVAPLRIGRGVQNKVLEAMAMARPVVASAAAFEGIEAEPDRHLLVADDAIAFAETIGALLNDGPRAAKLGREARAHVAASYRWEARLAPLTDHLFPISGQTARAA